jgi:hypothetical protein
MPYVCCKKTFYLIIVASLGFSACELVSSSKSGLGIGDNSSSQRSVSSASALTSISAALQSEIVTYDSSCRIHSNAVQQAAKAGFDLSAGVIQRDLDVASIPALNTGYAAGH